MKNFLLALAALFLVACSFHSEKSLNSHQKQAKQSTAKKISQKLTDTSKDTRIRLINHKGEMACYVPITPKTCGAYLAISTCNTSGAKAVRYDTFSRIAYDFEGVSFCITVPEKITVYHRAKVCVDLKSCLINDSKQQWKVKEGVIMSADKRYGFKDDNTYIYAVHCLEKELYALHPSMKTRLKTIATPYNISISMALAWNKSSVYGSERFFIDDGSLSKDTELFYKQIGYITMYDGKWGLKCFYSNLKDKNKDWAWWNTCMDSKIPNDKAFWRLIPYAKNQILLQNRDNHFIRVAILGGRLM